MLLKKEFLDREFLAFCQQEHDKAKYYLNTCGKPTTELDVFNIKFNKETVTIFKEFLK